MPDTTPDPISAEVAQWLAEDGLDPQTYARLWEAMASGFARLQPKAADAFLQGFLAVARPAAARKIARSTSWLSDFGVSGDPDGRCSC